MAAPRYRPLQTSDDSSATQLKPSPHAAVRPVDYEDVALDKIVVVEDGIPPMKAHLPPRNSAPVIHVKFLNGLRGFAAILVVLEHCNYFLDINPGGTGVDIFFVLSAFLLTLLFERKTRQLLARHVTRRQWAVMLLDYFVRRFLRVYPLFFLVALAVAQLSAEDQLHYFFVYPSTEYDLSEVLTFKFEARFHVFWTLPVEIGYYLLIPPFVAVIVVLGRNWWVFAAPLYVWIFNEGLYDIRTHHMPLRPHLPTFVAGSLGAIVYTQLDGWLKANQSEFKAWHRLIVRLIEAVTFSLLLSTVFRGLLFHWVFDNPVASEDGSRFISVSLTIVMVIEMLLPSAISRALEWNVFCYTGKVSYSLYLLHSFVIYNPANQMQQWWYDRVFTDFWATLLIASVSYWLIEYPLQRAASRFSKLVTVWSCAQKA